MGDFVSAVGREFGIGGGKRGRELESSTQPRGGKVSQPSGGKGTEDFSVEGFVTEVGKAAVVAGTTAAVTSLFTPDPAPPAEVAGPSAAEIEAQKEQDELLKTRERKAAAERGSRQKVITARAAGPQTLFKREGEIPRAVKLGGGRRA